VTAAQRGMALPLALLALVVIAAIVAGGFGAALLEQRIGRNLLYAVQAAGAAEAGAAAVVGEWEGHGLGLLAPGDSATLPVASLPARTAYSPTVVRLNGELFLVRVAGVRNNADGAKLALREVGLLVRLADSALPGEPPVRPLRNRPWAQ
jgi:Tfp pilus assembly protein PilX